jgi:transposase
MMKRGQRGYSEDFRREAVRLANTGRKPLAQIARELGINPETLRLWRQRVANTSGANDSPGAVPSVEEENRRLRRENARLLEEREILKKAAAFFAKDAQ